MGTFYITTPIYYVNDEPHIGHAYTTIMADVLARYHRLAGDDVLFLTGTDEHGQKVDEAAKKRNLDPQTHADEMVLRFQDLWKILNISNDDFIRTTEDRHKKVVTEILQRLYDAGEMYADNYEGWYCIPDERFWTEKDLVDGNCPDCGRPVTKITEKNYFFRMSKYQDWLIEHIEKNPNFIRPEKRKNEILGFLRQPLGDLCISRPKSRLNWGIPLPFDEDYVCYVWFDALINYITAPGYLADDARFEHWWPASCHLIGKDILTTHCVYWPTMLKAIGAPLPETVMGHGFWLVDETKMGKSLGNAVKPLDLVDKYGVDAFRYFLVREMTLGQDSNFGEVAFVQRYNTELANELGNLLNRSVVMADRYLDCVIPEVDKNHVALANLKAQSQKTLDGVVLAIDGLNPNAVLDAIWQLVREANRFVEVQAPWHLAKDENKRAELEVTIYGLLETTRQLAVLLFPVIPAKALEIWHQIGAVGLPEDVSVSDLKQWGGLQSGGITKPGDPVFPRIEEVKVSDEIAEKAEEKPQAEPKESKPKEDLISFKEFQKLKLRVARIESAEKVEGADRLLKLQISLGDEKRQLVAGIAQHYETETLVGKQIVIVANLEPAKIRGVESQGMLLAASDGSGLTLLSPEGEISDGAEVR
ncbi:MAG: methionyl-tRNA synthetase [Candidatus Latescibacterota bacterium]|jgi:methionyl-tRNA synthetase